MQVANWAVQPAAAEAYAGLSRAALRSLHASGIIPARAQLRAQDVVAARLCRHLYWHGPSATAPGESPERDEMRRTCAEIVSKVGKLLRGRSVPERIVVSLEDASVKTIEEPGDWVNLGLGKNVLAGVWMSFPLGQWWDEARALPTGPVKVVAPAT